MEKQTFYKITFRDTYTREKLSSSLGKLNTVRHAHKNPNLVCKMCMCESKSEDRDHLNWKSNRTSRVGTLLWNLVHLVIFEYEYLDSSPTRVWGKKRGCVLIKQGAVRTCIIISVFMYLTETTTWKFYTSLRYDCSVLCTYGTRFAKNCHENWVEKIRCLLFFLRQMTDSLSCRKSLLA
jgi:hypothetical protein